MEHLTGGTVEFHVPLFAHGADGTLVDGDLRFLAVHFTAYIELLNLEYAHKLAQGIFRCRVGEMDRHISGHLPAGGHSQRWGRLADKLLDGIDEHIQEKADLDKGLFMILHA